MLYFILILILMGKYVIVYFNFNLLSASEILAIHTIWLAAGTDDCLQYFTTVINLYWFCFILKWESVRI